MVAVGNWVTGASRRRNCSGTPSRRCRIDSPVSLATEQDAAMPISPTARVHPTAVISAEAELADNVEVGAFAVLEGRVRLGPGCIIRPHALLCGPITLGRANTVFPGAILGEAPQHLKYNNEA